MSMKPTSPVPDPAAVPVANGPRFSLKPSKQTVYILIGLTVVTLVAAAAFFVWQQSLISELDAKIASKTNDVNDSKKVARQLDDVRANYEATRTRISNLESSVTPTEYVPTLLKQIEILAKDTSLRVDNTRAAYQPAPPPPADAEERKKNPPQPYDKEAITMQVRGRYWDVANFLFRLTTFPKILSVERIDFHPDGNIPDKSPILECNLTMTGYLFKSDTPLPPAVEPAAGGVTVPNLPTKMPSLPARPTVGTE